MGPKTPHSTVLSVEEEKVAAVFRQHTLLPLDDCLYALQATIPQLTRFSLHRCFQRHGISRLPEVEGDRVARKKFKSPTKAVYICADQSVTGIFRLHSRGGPYIHKIFDTTHWAEMEAAVERATPTAEPKARPRRKPLPEHLHVRLSPTFFMVTPVPIAAASCASSAKMSPSNWSTSRIASRSFVTCGRSLHAADVTASLKRLRRHLPIRHRYFHLLQQIHDLFRLIDLPSHFLGSFCPVLSFLLAHFLPGTPKMRN
jgi:hypothetical protein